ncbi:hypothetical protein KC929_00795 [Patescibacteria group bacterium]|nr:hypothetical protein [Patescibacteria group bacterium]
MHPHQKKRQRKARRQSHLMGLPVNGELIKVNPLEGHALSAMRTLFVTPEILESNEKEVLIRLSLDRIGIHKDVKVFVGSSSRFSWDHHTLSVEVPNLNQITLFKNLLRSELKDYFSKKHFVMDKLIAVTQNVLYTEHEWLPFSVECHPELEDTGVDLFFRYDRADSQYQGLCLSLSEKRHKVFQIDNPFIRVIEEQNPIILDTSFLNMPGERLEDRLRWHLHAYLKKVKVA